MENMNENVQGLIIPLAIVLLLVAALIGGIVFLFTYEGGESGSGIGGEKEEDKIDNIFEENNKSEDNINITTTMNAVFKTNQGDIEIEFYSEDAPKTVANFVKLAGEGFYNETKFHRVIKDFMIQGGDPSSKDDSRQDMWGTGGPGYQFEDEIHANNNNLTGTIAMANSGPNTNGSQFFINTADNDFLNSKHTVFGKVISGMEVVRKIEDTETGEQDRPVTPMIINSIEIISE